MPGCGGGPHGPWPDLREKTESKFSCVGHLDECGFPTRAPASSRSASQVLISALHGPKTPPIRFLRAAKRCNRSGK